MINFRKKIIYTLLFSAIVVFCTGSFALAEEKINAGVVYEFYLDVQNQIVQPKKFSVDKLPKIDDSQLNLAYYKDFRPLNMLSMRNTYSVKKRNLAPLKFQNIPKEYTISLNQNKIAQAAKITPSFDELFSRALNFKDKEKYKEALEVIDIAISNDPLNVNAHFLKADLLRLAGKNKDSVIEYMLAINIDPCCTDAYFNIAKIFESSNNKELALEYYRYAYTTNPGDYEIRNIILNYEKQMIN